MSCSNCEVRISQIRGTPTNYKVHFINGGENVEIDGTVVNPIYENISKADINNGINIYVGGPEDTTGYAQFWDGNDITIRFENFFNADCYRDFTVSCTPETTTTVAATDCCLESQFKFATHGYYFVDHDASQGNYDSPQLFGVTTRGFAPGTDPNRYTQTLQADGEGVLTENYGTDFAGGRLCLDPIISDVSDVLVTPYSYNIICQKGTTFVDAYGDATYADQSNWLGYTTLTPGSPCGNIQLARDFAGSDRRVVYVNPNGECYSGTLPAGGGISILTFIE